MIGTLRRQAQQHHQANRLDEAENLFKQVLAEAPQDPESLYGLGIIAYQRQRYRESVELLGRAINVLPTEPNLWGRRGLALMKMGLVEESLGHFDQALKLKPGNVEVLNNRAIALKSLGRFNDAISAFDEALKRMPTLAEAWLNRGNALDGVGRTQEAIESVNRAIALRPDHSEAYFNRGNFQLSSREYEGARESFEYAVRFSAPSESALGALVHAKMHLCDWSGLDEARETISQGLAQGQRLIGAFATLALFDDPAMQLEANRMQAAHSAKQHVSRLPAPKSRIIDAKIRVGYFSADFQQHPMMHLMAEMFERHDRTRFELFAFSNGDDTGDPWRERVKKQFDAFHDIRKMSDLEVVKLARAIGIDIAVDLSGYTGGCRPGVFLTRAAPVQVNYLGYPSTTALPNMDYIIADETLIPETHRRYYTEKILYMPHCYQVNCSEREIAKKSISRTDFGLPEEAFVYCSFNTQYKITPWMFDRWMNLLKAVEGSVLWVLARGDIARENLRREAHSRGVDPTRLIFADHLPTDEHLQRIKLADLMLDSTPYNAHTTGSDCLRVGVPMVTMLGESFAARVGASLLNTVGLPELITPDLESFEDLAIALGRDKMRLEAIRARLVELAPKSPLFDTQAFTQALERHFESLVARGGE